jgi:hypothetical protein
MPTVYEPFDFDEPPEYISDEVKKTYITSMIDLAKDDKTSVNVYIILSLGFLGYIFTQNAFVAFKESLFLKIILLVGCISLIISAICFFWYWRKIHKCQIHLTGCILTLNAKKAQLLWIELWNQNKVLFKTGLVLVCFGIGILCISFLIKNIFL